MAPLFSRNADLGPALSLTGWRKIAIGTWRTAGDPSVYGTLEFDAEPAMAYVEKLRRETGLKITLTHIVGRALAKTLAAHPDINCLLRWGRLYPRTSVDVFFQVATDAEGKDLSGMVIRQADKKSIVELAKEMQERTDAIRKKGDPAFAKMKGMMKLMPGIVTGPLITLTGLLMYSLNLWSSLLGTPRDPFGSAMITSIGSLGLDSAYAPLVPYSRVPLLLALGVAQPRPWVRDGKLTIVNIARICATIDHRLIDGVHAGKMSQTLKKILADPEREL